MLRHPGRTAAVLSVTRAPSGNGIGGKVELLGTPGTDGSLLRSGRDCIVMLVQDATVNILVSAYLSDINGAAPSLKIDRIALDQPDMAARPASAVSSGTAGSADNFPVAGKSATALPIQISANGISVIGHFERLGDIVASGGADPGVNGDDLRLEGFQLEWPDKPTGLDILYGVGIEGVGRMPTVKTGKYAGTRGEAKRVIELTLTLNGPDSEMFRLEGEARFSGGFHVPLSSGLPLSGPSGMEHLTGLRIDVLPVDANTVNPWDASASTKVFKSGASAPATKKSSKQGKAKAA